MIFRALIYAVGAGILPSIIWLWFWLQEDKLHPEPKRIIIRSFIAGMIAVVIALPFEHFISVHFEETAIIAFLLFAVVEELLKYWAASWSALKTKHDDEPIDCVIYLITSALGFAALENIFFLIQPFLSNDDLRGIITGNLRFVGANLLHVISSAIIGVFIAFAFYKNKWQKRLFLLCGIALAIILHALFNFSIINDSGHSLIIIFGLVWLSIIILILVFEKIKGIKKTNS